MKKILLLFFLIFNFSSFCFATPSRKLVVLLDWFANPNHAPLFVAKEQGFFKEQGLEVNLIGPADPSDPPKLVAAGKADIAITYEPQFIEQVDQGLPLIRVGTLIDQPLNCLTVLKSGPIQTISQLKNKNIGCSTSGIGNIMLKVMLEKNNLTLKDIHSVNVHYALTQSLLAKKVDAVTGMMRNFEIIQLQLANQPARIFLPELNGVPSYSELIFIANKNTFSPLLLSHFLIALKKGVDYLQKHPEETWKTFAKEHPELNDELNHRAWLMSLPYFTKFPEKFDEKKWQNFIVFMQKNNLITHPKPLSSYVVNVIKD